MRQILLSIAVAVTASSGAWGQTAPVPQPNGDGANQTAETSFSFSSGVLYTSGDYGEAQNTDITIVPLSARARTGPFRFSATLPYLRVTSPGNIVIGGDGPVIIDPSASTTRRTREGWGDLSLGAAYTLPSGSLGALDVELSARVKVPTAAKSQALTTGKTDYAGAIEISYNHGGWMPFANVGYRVFGSPAGIDLRDGPTASVGVVRTFGTIVAIVSYDYARSASDAAEDSHEIFAALSGPLTERLNWTAFGIAGLSNGSPDYGVGALLTFRVE